LNGRSEFSADLNSLLISLALHLAVFGILWAVGRQWLNSTVNTNIEIIKSSVRVDLVSMPKFTLKELEAIQDLPHVEETVTKEVVEKAPEVTDEKDVTFKTKATSFDDFLNSQSNKKLKLKKKVEVKIKVKKENPLFGINKKELEKIIHAGNKISKGIALTGDSDADIKKVESEKYITGLISRIKRYWKLPSYLIDEDLNCAIRVFLKKNGNIIKLSIFESSGVKEYDEKALDAIKKAGPYDPLVEQIADRGARGDFVVGFPL
jgi:colicin import membrane protein